MKSFTRKEVFILSVLYYHLEIISHLHGSLLFKTQKEKHVLIQHIPCNVTITNELMKGTFFEVGVG
jgi:hypothetical protein